MPLCEGRATGPGQVQPCPDSRNDASVRGRQGDLMLCDACTEFRFPADSAATVSNTPSMMKNEVLYFIQNKCNVLPGDSVISICADFYTCAELEEARLLLSDILSSSRGPTSTKSLSRHTGADDVKRRKIANDLLKTCLDPNLQLPTFCSTNIQRIPSVGLEHLDVSSLLQELAALRAEVRSFVSMRAEIRDIRKTVRSSTAAAATAAAVPEVTPMSDESSIATTTAAQVLTAAVQSGAIQANEVKVKRCPTVVVGKATNKKMKAVVTKRKVNVFVSRLSPDTSVNDVRSCAAETLAEVCGAMLPDDCLKCEQLETRYQTYASYWVSFAVDPGLYDTAAAALVSAEAWPQRVRVRRYYPMRNG